MDSPNDAIDDALNPSGGQDEGHEPATLDNPDDIVVDDDLVVHIPADDDAPRPGDDLDPDDAP